MNEPVKLRDLHPGRAAEFTKTVTEQDVYAFAGITGDFNPVHVDEEYARTTRFKGRVAHGMLAAGMISTVLGTILPGRGTIYLGQELRFTAPVRFGDTLTVRVEVLDVREDKRIVTLRTVVANQEGTTVIDGKATVMAPLEFVPAPS